MLKKHHFILFLFFFLATSCNVSAFAASTPGAIQYLCELGISFYKEGRYDDALQEFNKALILDSSNETARKYIDTILAKKYLPQEQEKEPAAIESPKEPVKESIKAAAKKAPREAAMKEVFTQYSAKSDSAKPKKSALSRETAMESAFKQSSKVAKEPVKEAVKEPKKAQKETREEESSEQETESALKITGESQVSFGFTPEDAIWKQANADLNEKNYRVLSNTAYNRRDNTYDTRVYDRLRVNVDTKNKEGFNLHSNITVDPWSFTGKTERRTISVGTAAGDFAEIELKYWSNTRYTINETIFTLRNGASIALPEIKVVDGKTESAIPVANTWAETLTIPQLKINREFQPLREFWVEYTEAETFKLRFFPVAYQDQALTSDDPLTLSNNKIWWEESPWLDSWLRGRTNPGGVPVDFTRGKWDDSLSFFTRDSDGTRLAALRGLSFELKNDALSLASSFASPKGLWQDYDSFDNLINATRLNYRLLDNLSMGSVFTYRLGLTEKNKRDTSNYVWGFDTAYEPVEGLKLSLEVATSDNRQDIASDGYKTKSRGNAFYTSLVGTFPRKGLMDLKYGYSEIKPEEEDSLFAKYRFYAAHMDTGFNPSLSTYRQTRRDTFWGRHIHFRKPFDNYSAGLYSSSLKWEDIEPFRIGNGIDIGRDVLGLRLETSLFDKRFDNLLDVRNVHDVGGKFLENVARDEVTYKVTDKLTSKLLGLYQRMPRTITGVDPFIYNTNTGIFLNNAAIVNDRDPTLKTGSLGLEYAFTESVALSGVWEHTNDSTLAYDDYPRGNLNSTSFTTFSEFDKVFRREDPFLYSQTLFPLPPYPFYNIFKTGLRFEPLDNLDLYLDYTRNSFKSAGLIDDNINHIGLEAAYTPTKKLGFYLRYTFSRWNDLTLMTQSASHYYLSHHNVFTEFRYLPSADDEFVLQYGESGRSPLAIIKYDPFGGSLATLDTQHIVRMYYRRKF